MNTENKNTEVDNTDKKLHISDVMNSILLSKFEIYLINTLKFDINDIVIARQQRKEFAIEWSNKYCS
jgi:predicted  nucleic acid-binding Zn-ribbon protein